MWQSRSGKKKRLWSPEVKREPGDSTNSRLAESGLGTGRDAKALSGWRLENATGIVAGTKAVRELQQ